MSRQTLTDTQIKNARPDPQKLRRLSDQDGLHLEISPAGGKWWRFRYRFAAREKMLSLGVYPEVGLKEAREARNEFRKLLAKGIDPSQQRKADKLAQQEALGNTFEVVGRRWFDSRLTTWVPKHAERILSRLERDVFPSLGTRPIIEIKVPEVVAALRRIEARGVLHTARRAKSECEQIFAFAIAEGICELNPAAGIEKALKALPKVAHHAAITEPKKFGDLLRLIHTYEGVDITVGSALRLNPLIPVRPGELRSAKWKDVDLDDAVWHFELSKTLHSGVINLIVPLSRQAVAILRELHRSTGRGEYVFPNPRTRLRPMSENGVLAALRSLGVTAEEATGHGFRASFRTMAAEQLKLPADLLEHQIGHLVRWPNGRAYDRSEFVPERRAIMQQWADYCDRLRADSEQQCGRVIPIVA